LSIIFYDSVVKTGGSTEVLVCCFWPF